jgi:GTPase-associated protein 1, N-terminal domain type 1
MNQSSMVVDQCLFGYEDGHRLMASSMQLGDELSDLTELSDLAPGVVFIGSNGYWTGVPAPKIGRYALMRTWPAPEMSRPGCVWTHVLLLEPSVLESVSDLSALVQLFKRPSGHFEQSQYRDQLFIESAFVSSPFGWTVGSDRVLRDLLATLYGTGRLSVPVGAPEQADAPLFALWSQQWPRLRRNFRFQTAVTRDPRRVSVGRFDIYLQLEGGGNVLPLPVSTDWVEAAAQDVAYGSNGVLRSFLWRYGTDVKRQRGSFRPLINVELLHRSDKPDAGPSLLKLITEAFPKSNDAVTLKQDIIDGVLVPHAQLDVFWFVLANGGGAVFPLPSGSGVSRLAQLWPDRPDDLLHLAERTADARDELGKSVFEAVTSAVPTEEFWELTSAYPRVRERMVAARPELLTSDAVLSLDNGALLSFIELVAVESPVGQMLIPKVLSRDDSRLVEVLIERYPQAVASEVIAALDGGSVTVGAAWLRGLVRRTAVLLDPIVMKRIGRTSLLFELAERLGWLNDSVVSAGTQPWISALARANNDLPDDKRETLEAFLVGLALVCGGGGGRQLLEQFFDRVHHQILMTRLPWRAISILSPCLPDVGWVRGWDTGLRLRLAVATSYVRNGYPTASYAALTRSKKARAMLAKAAAEVNGGEHLSQAVAGF